MYTVPLSAKVAVGMCVRAWHFVHGILCIMSTGTIWMGSGEGGRSLGEVVGGTRWDGDGGE